MYDLAENKSIGYEKAFKLAIRIVKMCKYLQEEKREYIITKQIFRSATSIGANLKEAIYAQSDKDYLHKMYIALKESAETEYWLELLKETDYIQEEIFQSLHKDNEEIIKILTATTKTLKNKISN